MDGILYRNGLLEKWSCAKELAGTLRKMAGEAYAAGDDSCARFLREWADREDDDVKARRTALDEERKRERVARSERCGADSAWDELAGLILEYGGWGEGSD